MDRLYIEPEVPTTPCAVANHNGTDRCFVSRKFGIISRNVLAFGLRRPMSLINGRSYQRLVNHAQGELSCLGLYTVGLIDGRSLPSTIVAL